MNTAIFISGLCEHHNEVLVQMDKIRCAQNEIADALRTLEIEVGNVEFKKENGACKPVLMVDEKILIECCQRMVENSNLIQETYGRLIEAGVFEKKSRCVRL